MQELKSRLTIEFPLIESALQKSCADLPQTVRPIAEHIFSAGGKRLRPFLVVIMARFFGYQNQDIYDLAVCMEMLHAATLLHDDILDGADTRRGSIAAHKCFDLNSTILVGDALLAAANMRVSQYDDVRLCRCFSEATLQTATGEILEIQYLRRLDQSPDIYDKIVLGKTAWLLRASCLMGALKANVSDSTLEAVANYGQELGMAFQMVDDALDFAPEAITGKPSGGDLCEGKLTPPIRMYRESLHGKAQNDFDLAFSTGSFTPDEAAKLGEEICRLGFDLKTRQIAGASLDKARESLHILNADNAANDSNEQEFTILMQMADYVQQRQK